MKKKDLKRKLFLHKETISNLNSVFGGGDTNTTDTIGPVGPITIAVNCGTNKENCVYVVEQTAKCGTPTVRQNCQTVGLCETENPGG